MNETIVKQADSPEAVALELTTRIANKEKLGSQAKDYRKEYLDLYAECLEATQNNRVFARDK